MRKISNVFTWSLKHYYFTKYSVFIFMILFVLMAFAYQFDDILFLRPQSFHQWRQCDCLSFTLNYYNYDLDFFSPQLHFLADDGTGKTASDCPIIYYGVAKLWQVFGYHEFIYRLVVLMLCFWGLLALMRTIEDVLKDSVIALFISLLIYTSTILVYYSNNFLMNVPSFSFALIGLHYFYRFFKTQKNIFLYFSMLLYLIGGLLKIPALTSFMAILGLFILEFFGIIKLKNDQKLFKLQNYQLIPFLLVILVIFAWYYYAHGYNNTYNRDLFLIGILPIWDLSWERINTIIEHARILWLDSYHSIHVQVASILMLLYVFIFSKKQNKTLLLFTSFLFVGFVLFLMLWFDVFDNHDYYLINQLILMVGIFLTFFHYLKKKHPVMFNSFVFRTILLAVLIHNVFLTADKIDFRYTSWPNEGHLAETLALEDINPYLDSIGVHENTKVLFMHDQSFNISLYLMNRRGYTAKRTVDQHSFLKKLQKVDYLLINDSSLLEKDFIRTSIQWKRGEYKNIQIYSLKK